MLAFILPGLEGSETWLLDGNWIFYGMWANLFIHVYVFGLTVSWSVYSVLIQRMVRRAAVMNLTGVQLLREGNLSAQ